MMGQGFNERNGFLVEMHSENYISFGDVCPFPGINIETLDDIEDTFPAVCKELLTRSLYLTNDNLDFIKYPSLRFGIESAIYDLKAQTEGKSFPELLGNSPNSDICVAKLITLNDNLEDQINSGIAAGYKSFKIKIDENSILYTLNVLRSFKKLDIKFRLDANRGLQLENMIRVFEPDDTGFIEYIEEPFEISSTIKNTFSNYKILFDKTGLKIALDETLLEIEDINILPDMDWLNALIIKPVAIGSINTLSKINDFAKKHDIKLVLSSVFESEIGIKYLYYLASGLKLEHDQGFDTFKYYNRAGLGYLDFLTTYKVEITEFDKLKIDISDKELIYTNSNYKISDTAVISDRSYTYGDLSNMINRAESLLAEQNIGEFDKVAIHLDNSIDYISFFFACQNLKAIAVLISTRIPDKQVNDICEDNSCKLLISNGINECSIPVVSNELAHQIISANNFNASFLNNLELEQESDIMFTSGSSGRPKGVLHTYGNHYFNALGSNCNILLNRNDRWLLSLPLYHVGGLSIIFRCFLSGATVVIEDKDYSLEDNIFRNKITHISLVPTQLYRLLDTKSGIKALKLLKYILVGGAPVSRSLIKQCELHHIELHISYGSTEMASQIVTYSTSNNNYKPLKYRDIQIVDNEILVRGKCLAKSYIEEGKLIDLKDEKGWFHTNDLGEYDELGKIKLYGRKDNMFISGGENIQPEEIESVIREMNGVIEVFVVPANDEEFGQRPIAFVDSIKAIDLNKLREFLNKKIAPYKIPIALYQISDDMKISGIKLSRKYFNELANTIHRPL